MSQADGPVVIEFLTLIYQFDQNGLMVPRAGVEPTLANYLLHTGYKSAVLPLNYRGKIYHIETHSLTPMMRSLDNRYLSCFSMMDECVSIWSRIGVSIPSHWVEGPVATPAASCDIMNL